jgi:hypothetical protein
MGWVTIKTYNFGHEAAIAQHLLEEEGIETHLMDALSIQMNPLYSNALGGVKLQVWEEDAERAMQLLLENDMLQEGDIASNGNIEGNEAIEEEADFNEESVEGNHPIEDRPFSRWLIIGIVFTVIAVAAGISYYLTPSTEEKLYSSYWCVNYALVGANTYYPNTLQTRVVLSGECYEKINFMSNGKVYFPGFNTSASFGTWHMNGERVNIALYDSALQVLNGSYKPVFDGGNLALKGEHVFISTTAAR